MNQYKIWKVWAHFVGLFGCFLLGSIIGVLPRIMYGLQDELGWIVFLSEILRIVATLGLLMLYAKYILKNNFNNRLLNIKHFQPAKWTLIGVVLPMLLILIFWITGEMKITFGKADWSVIINSLLMSLGLSLAAGITEEVVFRGYLIAILKVKYGTLVAALTPSVLFVALHLTGVQSISGALQLLVAGLAVSIMFIVIRYYSGSIWNASLVHFIWNFVILNELVAFGANINSSKLINLDYVTNSIFSGGEFGVEASIPAILIYLLTALLVWKMTKDKGQKSWGTEQVM